MNDDFYKNRSVKDTEITALPQSTEQQTTSSKRDGDRISALYSEYYYSEKHSP